MTETKSYSVFQQALLDALLADYQNLPPEDAITEPFSDTFLLWGEKCIRWSKSNHFRTISIVKKLVIAAIIAALMVGSVIAYPIVRDAVIKYFFTAHEERIGIVFDPVQAATAPREINEIYCVGYVPPEYVPMGEDITPAAATYFWVTETGQYMIFTQTLIPENAEDDTRLGLDTDAVKETVLMGEYMVDVVRNPEMNQLVWTNNAYFFMLEVPVDIQLTEIEKIFLSISLSS